MSISKPKICFISGAVQDRYIDQFNNKVNTLSSEFDYYVYTDKPDKINSGNKKLRIFDLYELTKRTPNTVKYEVVSGSTKFNKYPNNTRRHILNQAFEDGYDCVIWNDVDARLRVNEDRVYQVVNNLPINHIHTQGSIYRNRPDSNNIMPFFNNAQVLKDLNIQVDSSELIVHDGPTCIYYFDKETQSKYIKAWDKVTEYGYTNPYLHNSGANRASAETYAIAIANVEVKQTDALLFNVKHDLSIRY